MSFRLSAASFGALVLIVSIVGCGQDLSNVPEAKARDDTFTPYQEYVSAAIRSVDLLNPLEYRLVGRRDRRTSVVTMHARLGVTYRANHRRLYEIARNDRAEALRISVILRKFPMCPKGPCEFYEEFWVDLPEADVRAAADRGYRFKIFARTGSENVIVVPKELIQSLLRSMGEGAPATVADRKS